MSAFHRREFQREAGIRLRFHRQRARHTQDEIATVLEMKRASYANIESGRVRLPADVAWRLAIHYGLPITSLLPEPKQ